MPVGITHHSPSKRHARTYYEYPASPLTTAGARDGHHRWSLERAIEGDASEGELSWRSGERRREAEQPRAATLEDGDREWEMWRSGSIFDSTRLDAAVRRRRRRGIDRRAPLLSLPQPWLGFSPIASSSLLVTPSRFPSLMAYIIPRLKN